jgi:hypothetical protein
MSIYKKLFEAKKEIGKISKDSTNPFYKSKYFDINSLLEHVEPILQKHGLLLLQPIEDNIVYSKIIDIDDLKTGVLSGLALTNQTDPQKRGSEITYYRRYTLQSLLGLQAEDDDANATVKQTIEDNRPWLDEKGFTYLMESGNEEQIQTAFKTRRMKKEYKAKLETKYK